MSTNNNGDGENNNRPDRSADAREGLPSGREAIRREGAGMDPERREAIRREAATGREDRDPADFEVVGGEARLSESGRREVARERAAEGSEYQPGDFRVTDDGQVVLTDAARQEAAAEEVGGTPEDFQVTEDGSVEYTSSAREERVIEEVAGDLSGVETGDLTLEGEQVSLSPEAQKRRLVEQDDSLDSDDVVVQDGEVQLTDAARNQRLKQQVASEYEGVTTNELRVTDDGSVVKRDLEPDEMPGVSMEGERFISKGSQETFAKISAANNSEYAPNDFMIEGDEVVLDELARENREEVIESQNLAKQSAVARVAGENPGLEQSDLMAVQQGDQISVQLTDDALLDQAAAQSDAWRESDLRVTGEGTARSVEVVPATQEAARQEQIQDLREQAASENPFDPEDFAVETVQEDGQTVYRTDVREGVEPQYEQYLREQAAEQSDGLDPSDITLTETESGYSTRPTDAALREQAAAGSEGLAPEDFTVRETDSGFETVPESEALREAAASGSDALDPSDFEVVETESGFSAQPVDGAQREAITEQVLSQAEEATAEDVVVYETSEGELRGGLSREAKREAIRSDIAEQNPGLDPEDVTLSGVVPASEVVDRFDINDDGRLDGEEAERAQEFVAENDVTGRDQLAVQAATSDLTVDISEEGRQDSLFAQFDEDTGTVTRYSVENGELVSRESDIIESRSDVAFAGEGGETTIQTASDEATRELILKRIRENYDGSSRVTMSEIDFQTNDEGEIVGGQLNQYDDDGDPPPSADASGPSGGETDVRLSTDYMGTVVDVGAEAGGETGGGGGQSYDVRDAVGSATINTAVGVDGDVTTTIEGASGAETVDPVADDLVSVDVGADQSQAAVRAVESQLQQVQDEIDTSVELSTDSIGTTVDVDADVSADVPRANVSAGLDTTTLGTTGTLRQEMRQRTPRAAGPGPALDVETMGIQSVRSQPDDVVVGGVNVNDALGDDSPDQPVGTAERFGDVPITIPEAVPGVGGGQFEDVVGGVGEDITGGFRTAGNVAGNLVNPPSAFEQTPDGIEIESVTDRPESGVGRAVAGAVEGAGQIAAAPANVLVGVKEFGELGVEAADEIGEDVERGPETGANTLPNYVIRDPDSTTAFASDVGIAAATAAAGGVEYASDNPFRFGGNVVGSLGASAGAIAGASRISSSAGAATRYAIQPGEEVASAGVSRAFPGVASRFPNNRIDWEEVAIQGGARASQRVARTARTARYEATEALSNQRFGTGRQYGTDFDVNAAASDTVARIRNEIDRVRDFAGSERAQADLTFGGSETEVEADVVTGDDLAGGTDFESDLRQQDLTQRQEIMRERAFEEQAAAREQFDDVGAGTELSGSGGEGPTIDADTLARQRADTESALEGATEPQVSSGMDVTGFESEFESAGQARATAVESRVGVVGREVSVGGGLDRGVAERPAVDVEDTPLAGESFVGMSGTALAAENEALAETTAEARERLRQASESRVAADGRVEIDGAFETGLGTGVETDLEQRFEAAEARLRSRAETELRREADTAPELAFESAFGRTETGLRSELAAESRLDQRLDQDTRLDTRTELETAQEVAQEFAQETEMAAPEVATETRFETETALETRYEGQFEWDPEETGIETEVELPGQPRTTDGSFGLFAGFDPQKFDNPIDTPFEALFGER